VPPVFRSNKPLFPRLPSVTNKRPDSFALYFGPSDTIGQWLSKSTEALKGLTEEVQLPKDIAGVDYFIKSLEALPDNTFFMGLARTKLWYLYDLGKLLRYPAHCLIAIIKED